MNQSAGMDIRMGTGGLRRSNTCSPDVRAQLCAKIGAGEYNSTIVDLLVFYANGRATLPYEFAAPIRAWIRGYAGTDREPILLRLYDRITVSGVNHTTA